MRFTRLPRAITGFHRGREPHPSVAPAAFKRACHGVAAIGGGTVSLFRPDGTPLSYRAARIETRTESLTVLCHRVYPLLAFLAGDVERIVHCGPEVSTFVSPICMASHFDAMTEFRTLDADWLMEDITADLLADLDETDLRPIVCHGPRRIGDLIFNDWD